MRNIPVCEENGKLPFLFLKRIRFVVHVGGKNGFICNRTGPLYWAELVERGSFASKNKAVIHRTEMAIS